MKITTYSFTYFYGSLFLYGGFYIGYQGCILLVTEPKCAGVIHTDFEKGFIRAEVIKYDDYVTLGSEAAVKAAGKMGVEGKEYVVQDGDIMHFLFNV